MSPKNDPRKRPTRRQGGRGEPPRGKGKGDGKRRDAAPGDRQASGRERRALTAVPTGDLPRWVRDEILRTTPKDRREPAVAHLARGVAAFADERFGAAHDQLKKAKDLAPRAATIRELLGLSAYHLERWEEALRELRTFRRLTGETTQMPVEIDCLRALDRPEEIEKTWRALEELSPSRETEDEARVVYASSLLDRGLVADAWRVVKPGRLVSNPPPSALRRWYVAARVARAAGDDSAAASIVEAIRAADADFPGIDAIEEPRET